MAFGLKIDDTVTVTSKDEFRKCGLRPFASKEVFIVGKSDVSYQDIRVALKEFVEETKAAHQEVAEAQKETETTLKEVAEAQKETEAALKNFAKETKASQQETEVALKNFVKETKASQQETEAALKNFVKETTVSHKKLNRSISKVNGNLINKWGRFVENLVHGDLVNLLAPWEISVKVVQPRMVYPEHGGNSAGEFDLVAMNGEEVVIIEVKSTLTVSDIHKFVGKLHVFQEALPDYKKKIIYAGVAYLELAQGALRVAKNKGLFMIKAPGGESKISAVTNEKGFQPTDFNSGRKK